MNLTFACTCHVDLPNVLVVREDKPVQHRSYILHHWVSLAPPSHQFAQCRNQPISAQDGCIQCPTCKAIFGTKRGNCPAGTMTYDVISTSLPGHEDCDTIRIVYDIQPGVQVCVSWWPSSQARYLIFIVELATSCSDRSCIKHSCIVRTAHMQKRSNDHIYMYMYMYTYMQLRSGVASIVFV